VKLPPLGFVPGAQTIHNGAAGRSAHAQGLDRFATYLASVRRHTIPAIVGSNMVAGSYEWVTLIPPFCEYIAIGCYATGRGTLEVDASTDSYNGSKTLVIGSGADHDFENDGIWVWFQDPITVTSDGTDRALDASDDSAPEIVQLTATITDYSGSETLEVHQLIVWPIPRGEANELSP